VAQNVEVGGSGAARFSVSEEGTLVFRASGATDGDELVWMDRTGKRVGTVGGPGRYQSPVLSPDGTQLAVEVHGQGSAPDLWIYDLERNLGSRFTFAENGAATPTWSPDGLRLAYVARGDGFNDIHVKSVGGSGADERLLRSNVATGLGYWAANGRWLTYVARGPGSSWDIHALSLEDSVRSVPVRTTSFAEYQPAISPDGSLLAYGSVESGGFEIFAQTFPGPGGKWRISTSGGLDPHWRGDGRELYYVGPGRTIMAVSVEPGTPPRFSLPRELFPTAATSGSNMRNRYDVSKDGQRFLVIAGGGEANVVGPTTVVLDWLGRLEKR
jgi:Tol biopolymer transport system component